MVIDLAAPKVTRPDKLYDGFSSVSLKLLPSEWTPLRTTLGISMVQTQVTVLMDFVYFHISSHTVDSKHLHRTAPLPLVVSFHELD